MVTQNVLKGFLDDGISVFKVSVQKSQKKSDNCWQGRTVKSYASNRKSSHFLKWTLQFQVLILIISNSSSNCTSNSRWFRIAWGNLICPFFPESVIGKRQEQLTALNYTIYLQHRKIGFSFVYMQNSVSTPAKCCTSEVLLLYWVSNTNSCYWKSALACNSQTLNQHTSPFSQFGVNILPRATLLLCPCECLSPPQWIWQLLVWDLSWFTVLLPAFLVPPDLWKRHISPGCVTPPLPALSRWNWDAWRVYWECSR